VRAAASENPRPRCSASCESISDRGARTPDVSAGRDEARTFARRNARGAWKKTKNIRGLQLRPPNTGYNKVDGLHHDSSMLNKTNA